MKTFLILALLIVGGLWAWNHHTESVHAAQARQELQQVQQNQSSSDSTQGNTTPITPSVPATDPAAVPPTPAVTSPSYCNPDGTGGQTCYTSGQVGDTYCNSNGLGGYTCN